MKRPRGRALILLGAASAVILVWAVLLVANAETGFSGCTISARFGWIAPLVSAVVLGGAAWALRTQGRADQEGPGTSGAVRCRACDREVLGQWRMCPYCGSMLGALRAESRGRAEEGAD
jgi:hypothetical protein